MKTALELLKQAKEILQTGGWCRYALRDGKGAHCALGAVREAQGPILEYQQWTVQQEATNALGAAARAVDSCAIDIVDFNDYGADTVDDVLDIFDKAIASLENNTSNTPA